MHRPEDTETEQLYDRLNSELDKIRKEYLSMFPNENLNEQPQEEGIHQAFEGSRPITKTSPIYKLLDTIINIKI